MKYKIFKQPTTKKDIETKVTSILEESDLSFQFVSNIDESNIVLMFSRSNEVQKLAEEKNKHVINISKPGSFGTTIPNNLVNHLKKLNFI